MLADLVARAGCRSCATVRTWREIVVERGPRDRRRPAVGERIAAGRVLVNGDVGRRRRGPARPGGRSRGTAMRGARDRSLSAVTWAMRGHDDGFPLVRHNVFFSDDYPAEFADDLRPGNRLPDEAHRLCLRPGSRRRCGRRGGWPVPERLLCLVNAPATGDARPFEPAEIEQCERRAFSLLARCGLTVDRRPERLGDDLAGGLRAAVPGDGRRALRPGLARLDGLVPPTGQRARSLPGLYGWRGAACTRGRACRWRDVGPAGGRGPDGAPRFDRERSTPAAISGGTSTR
jgi:hypothetical protein